jgi:hypothetical protein
MGGLAVFFQETATSVSAQDCKQDITLSPFASSRKRFEHAPLEA